MSRLSLDFNGTYPFAPFVKSVEYASASLTATGVNLTGVYVGSGQTAYGFEYCTDKEGSKTDVSGTKTEGQTKFTGYVTGLHSETLYYMRGYIVVGEVKVYGQWYEITTEANNIVVGVQAASSITATGAALSAAYTSNAANISAAKLQYCTDIEGEITDVAITPVTSPLTTTLTELTAATTYYFRCKLTSETVDTLGDWEEFTTLSE